MAADENETQLELRRLEADMKQKQDDRIRRERVYKMRVGELRDELEALKAEHTQWMDDEPAMCELRTLHKEIVANVGKLQDRTVRLVQEQERDLLEAFRGRLEDVRSELEKEKAKKDDGAGAWIERSRKLELDVDKERERADKLDRINQSLSQENARLKLEFESQEDDRAFLLKQLAAVKDDNAHMRSAIEAKKAHLEALEPSDAPPNIDTEAAAAAPVAVEPRLFGAHSDAAYRDMVAKLTKMLNLERKHADQVKAAHKEWLDQRTPLELALRDAVQHVAADVEKRPTQTTRRPTAQPTTGALDPAILARFSHADRERAIELWLSRDGVLDALYDDDRAGKRRSGCRLSKPDRSELLT